MAQIFSQHKLLLIGIVVLIAGGVWFGFSSEAPTSDLVTVPIDGASSPIEKNLITTLLTFRSVELDPKILTSPAFISLRDFSTQIVPEPVGRENPFAPLTTQMVVSGSTTTNAQIFAPQR